MNDLISRQAAIDAVETIGHIATMPDGDKCIRRSAAKYTLSMLPSAQPEPCEDAVSRHRLLSDLEELIVAWEKYPVMAEQRKGVEVAIGYVKTIPGAQLTIEERKKGEWIYNSPVTMKCNQCGLVIKDWDWHRFKYCPNCGAKMEG